MLYGSVRPQRDFLVILDAYARGRLPIGRLITHWLPLEQIGGGVRRAPATTAGSWSTSRPGFQHLFRSRAYPTATMRSPPRIAALAAVAALAAAAAAGVILTDDGDASHAPAAPSGTAIPQPSLSRLNLRTRRRLAPASRRIDLVAPPFSYPTLITNPLFPIGRLQSAVLLGRLQGRRWRAETTLLPGTTPVDWMGRRIATRRSQFVAYLNGRIFEVAVDLYAQADDGSVWYLGENAYAYHAGRVSDTDGTWGGRDRPAGADHAGPSAGRPGLPHQNIPGLVFEQVTVKRVGVTVRGPDGPVQGAMIGQELHMDETRLEDKVFAPGYGEFHSGQGDTFEATSLAVPADARPGPVPAAIAALARPPQHRTAPVAGMVRAWRGERASQPPLLAAQLTAALRQLRVAAAGRPAATAALDVAAAALDLELQYRPQPTLDRARFRLEMRRMLLDAGAGDAAGVRGDLATLRWIGDRISAAGSRLQALRATAARRLRSR